MNAILEQKNTNHNAESILNAVTALTPEITACSETIETGRRLPPQLIASLKQAGVFRMAMPHAWGGPELDPLSQLQIIEQLSAANASVGWCVMIGGDSGFFSSFIDQDIAREMYRDLDTVTAAALTPTGKAVKTKDGYKVSGRFPFSSGCHHSDWFVLGCKVYDGDTLCTLPNGTPETRQCFVPAKAVTILDTWHSTGLRGTGSNDLSVNECLVPKARSFSYQEPVCYRDTALYRFPLNILLNFSSVPLGVTQAALDALTGTGDRPSRTMTIDGKITEQRLLRDEPFVQDAAGRAAAMLSAARAYTYTTIGDIWDTLQAGRELTPQQMTAFQLLNPYVYETCTAAVELMYKVRGGSAVYSGNTLERCLRDIVTMNQHVMNSLRFYSSAGRILFGLPPEQILL
jgi:alkylation response protein AidB-like acyl-CoA dehydrogenase